MTLPPPSPSCSLKLPIVINKPFLVHVSIKASTLANAYKISLKSEILPAKSKSPCYSSHLKKHDTRHLIGRIVFLEWLLGSKISL